MSFKIASVFSDNMVLQQGKRLCVFGTGEPGEKVEAEVCMLLNEGERRTFSISEATVDSEGSWNLWLGALPVGTGYSMRVSSMGQSKTFNNVAAGEVFLAGGQSNMEFELRNCREALDNGLNQLKNEDEDIRFYYTQKRSYFDDAFFEAEEANGWQTMDSEGFGSWSAVAFFFASELYKRLRVPIGIIGCNWGGTSASCWMSSEALYSNSCTRLYMEALDNSPEITKTQEQQIKDYEDYIAFQAEWDKKAAKLYDSVAGITFEEIQNRIGKCLYPGPMNAASFFRPAGLYETMLKRVCPYTLRGFIYYQGETDESHADSYYELMSGLIKQWRRDWQDDELPFLFVQLPMHRYVGDPDNKSWCLLREAQERVYKTIRNTGLAVAIDQGEVNEIHPKYKQRVGQRLAWQALYHVYRIGSAMGSSAPMYKSMEIAEDKLLLTIENAKRTVVMDRLYGDVPYEAFMSEDIKSMFEQQKAKGFEIAGADGVYHPADAECTGNVIILSSPEVAEPVKARYLWTNYGEVNVYGFVDTKTEPLPLAPFRTDKYEKTT